MKKIEEKASYLLEKYGFMSAPIDVKGLIMELNIKLDSVDLGEDISGVLVTENGKSKIGYSKNESPQRQRFTLAHELGHYSLHVNENKNKLFVDNVKVMFRKEAITRTEKKQEIEANRFAAALLMPKNLIKEDFLNMKYEMHVLTDEDIVNELSKKYIVSQMAMTYRLMNLGLIEQYC